MAISKKSVKPVHVLAVAIAVLTSLLLIASVYNAITAPSAELQKQVDEVDAALEQIDQIQQKEAQQ